MPSARKPAGIETEDTNFNMNNHTILAINDTPDQLELLTFILGEAGYRVLTAESGVEGLKTAQRELPDLIISDVMMPEMDGIELCRLIRADNNLSSLPVLLISAMRKDSASVVEGLEAGADDYIEAPYEPMRLVAKAAQLIQHKIMEDALRESENRFRTMIENTTDIISIISGDGTIIYESPSLENVLGYKPEELIGKNAFDFVHPEDVSKVIEYFTHALKNPETASAKEYRFRHKNNSWQTMESVGKPFNDPTSGLVAVVNSRDITKRKKALEAQHESERRLRTIFDNAAIGMALVNSEWHCIQSNHALEKMLGYSGEELKQISFIEITHPDDITKSEVLAYEVIEDKRDYYQIEKRYIKKSGEIMWGNLTVSSLRSFSGDEQFVVGMIEDITERKLVEIALRDSEESYRILAETASDAIITIDVDSSILFINRAGERIFGYKVEEMIGQPLTMLMPKSMRSAHLAGIRRYIETGKRHLSWNSMEVVALHRDGHEFPLELSFGEHQDGKHFFIGIARDITERKQAQETLRKNEEKFKAQYKGNPVPTYTLKKAGNDFVFVDYNDAAEKITHKHIAGFLGTKASQAYADSPEVLENIHRCFDKKTIIQHEILFQLRTTGQLKHLDVSYVYVPPDLVMAHTRDISEQIKAEMSLRKSEERFRLVSNATNDALWDWDLVTDLLWLNEGGYNLLGYSPDEIDLDIGVWFEAIHPDDRERVINGAYAVIESGKNYWVDEYRLRSATGSWAFIFDRGYVVYDDEGKPLRMIGAAIDITERKQAESTLRFQKTLLEAQSEASIDGILVVTPTGEIISHNRRFVEMWEISDDVLTTKSDKITLKSILDKLVDPQEFLETVSYLYENPFIEDHVEISLKDGRTFERYSAPVIDTDDTHYGRVWFFRDVTKRIQEETAISEANERAIREYDRLLQRLATLAQTSGAARDLTTVFRAILDFTRASVPCSALFVSLYDEAQSQREGVYMWYNGKELDVSNIKPIHVGEGPVGQAVKSGEVTIVNDYQKTAGKKPTHVYLGFEEDSRDPHSTVIAPMEIKGKTIGTIEVQSYELAAYTQEHATAMRMAANIVANAIENVRLLAQERMSAEQLRLSQKLESVGRLAGGIAHDFNNMLTAINGYSDLTLRLLKADDPLRSNIEEIKKAGERSASLTHQLLAFSRQQVLKPKVLDLNQIVIEVSAMLKRLLGEDIQLITNLAPKLGQVEADPGQLTQVIMNLAVNARDAMPQGGEITIETRNVFLNAEYAARHFPTQPGSYVMLAVSDTGTGIDENTRQHIFEPFFTTKETGKGTGLGLPTVYGIVKQSGGYIWFDSEIGVGTTFNIYLPHLDKEIVSSEEENASEYIPKGVETILLVEDEEVVRNLSRQILEDCGYNVIEAGDGIEALSICRQSDCKIDLLITDIVMPKMSGRQLVEQMAALRPEIKVLYMSGYTDDAVVRQGVIRMDANFIQKPFTFNTLAQKVRDVIDAKNGL